VELAIEEPTREELGEGDEPDFGDVEPIQPP